MFNSVISKLKERILFLASWCGFSSKNKVNIVNEECLNSDNYLCSYILNTSNNIVKMENDGKCLYFRECCKHLAKKEYFLQIINRYNLISEEVFNVELKEINLRKFFKIGNLANKTSVIWKFLHGKDENIKKIGFRKDIANYDLMKIKRFMTYAWSEVFSYNLNRGVKIGNYQIYNSSRSVATYELSKILGLDYLIPKTKYVRINNGSFGVVMDEAKGVSFDSFAPEIRYRYVSRNLQRDLINLNFLDIICHEKDHRPDNYNVVLHNDKVWAISVFDNDSPACLFPTSNISFSTYVGCSRFIDKKGRVNRPFLDKEVIEKFLSTKDFEYKKRLKKYLSSCQLFFLIKRVHKLKKCILKSMKKKSLILLSKSEWNDETIKTESLGCYGLTYLKLFASDWQNINKDSI